MPDGKEAFQQAFVNDPEMQALADLIITGWPKDIKEVPHSLCLYWQHRETLTIDDGLVLQGEALVIPPAKRERVLHQLHQFHQGITKSQLLTHGSFFWPGINKTKCPVHQLLYILGHITQNLKSALPTIQWICQGICQVCQTCTPKSQTQWHEPTACLASTLSYTHQYQASISSSAIVPTLTQNNHSGQDMQQQPISHTSL